MSYGLQFWLGEISNNDETAFADYDNEFERNPDGEHPHPRFVELHDKLTARFPCLTKSEDTVWTDGPLINNFGSRVGGVAFGFGAIEQVVPFVVESATSLNIAILDPQTRTVYRPNESDCISRAAESAAVTGPRAIAHGRAVSEFLRQTPLLLQLGDPRAAVADAIRAVLAPLTVRPQACDAEQPGPGHCQIESVDQVCARCWGAEGPPHIGGHVAASIIDLTSRLDDAALRHFICLAEMNVSRPEQVAPCDGTVSAILLKERLIIFDTAYGPFEYELRLGPDQDIAVAVGDRISVGATLVPGEFDPNDRLDVFGANRVIDELTQRASVLLGTDPSPELARLWVPLVCGFLRVLDSGDTSFEARAVVPASLALSVANACYEKDCTIPPQLSGCAVPLSFAAHALIDARRPFDAADFLRS